MFIGSKSVNNISVVISISCLHAMEAVVSFLVPFANNVAYLVETDFQGSVICFLHDKDKIW